MLTPVKSLAEVNGPMKRGIAAAETGFEMIDSKAEEDTGTRELGHAQGHLRLENVAFRYPNAASLALLARGGMDADLYRLRFAATVAET
jgi:subfamily B ATP-binding cassette protein MsbA